MNADFADRILFRFDLSELVLGAICFTLEDRRFISISDVGCRIEVSKQTNPQSQITNPKSKCVFALKFFFQLLDKMRDFGVGFGVEISRESAANIVVLERFAA